MPCLCQIGAQRLVNRYCNGRGRYRPGVGVIRGVRARYSGDDQHCWRWSCKCTRYERWRPQAIMMRWYITREDDVVGSEETRDAHYCSVSLLHRHTCIYDGIQHVMSDDPRYLGRHLVAVGLVYGDVEGMMSLICSEGLARLISTTTGGRRSGIGGVGWMLCSLLASEWCV
jgi:hypothetical protein